MCFAQERWLRDQQDPKSNPCSSHEGFVLSQFWIHLVPLLTFYSRGWQLPWNKSLFYLLFLLWGMLILEDLLILEASVSPSVSSWKWVYLSLLFCAWVVYVISRPRNSELSSEILYLFSFLVCLGAPWLPHLVPGTPWCVASVWRDMSSPSQTCLPSPSETHGCASAADGNIIHFLMVKKKARVFLWTTLNQAAPKGWGESY